MTAAEPTAREPGGVTRPVIVAAVAGTFALAFAAFLLSYVALRDLAALAGIPAGQAWLWPLIVDGVILEATISVVALRNGSRTARRYAWFLLVAGAAVSVAANITHAIVAADSRVPALVAALVASVPPLVLVAMTHLTVELIRNSAPHHGSGIASEPPTELTVVPAPNQEAARQDIGTGRKQRAITGAPAGEERQRRREEAVRLDAENVPMREIARRLGVHPTTVSRWLHAPETATAAPGAATKEEDDEHDA